MSAPSPIRFATVGTGWIVDAFLEGAARVEGLRYEAAYSRDADRARSFAQRHGATLAFDSLEAMAASGRIDAVYIASPNALHFEQSMLFLRHGKHVLCEKPAAVREGEARALLHEASQNGVVFLEAITSLHLPRMKTLRETVEKLGRLSFARLDFSQYSSKYPAYLAGELPNIFNPALCTGALEDLGVYCVYPAIALFGRPLAVRASASFLGSGADASGCAILEYPAHQAVLSYSKVGQSRIGSEFIGERGTLSISSVSLLENLRLSDLKGDTHSLFGIEDRDVAMSYEARDFAACIENPVENASSYARWSRLMREVSDTMLEIRRCAGIRFPGDEF